MIRLIQLLVLVSDSQSLFLTPKENADRWKTCGFQNNPTTTTPRIQARDAPWLVHIDSNVTGFKISGSGVLISQNIVVTTIQSLFGGKRVSSPTLTESCKKWGSVDLGNQVLVSEMVCDDQKCTKERRNGQYMTRSVSLLGDCEKYNTLLFFLHFDTKFTNVPICLPNNRKPVAEEIVMAHAKSRFSATDPKDLYLKAELLLLNDPRWLSTQSGLLFYEPNSNDLASAIVRQNNSRFEMVGISWTEHGNTPAGNSYYLRDFFLNMQFYEKDICKTMGICPPVVHESPISMSSLSDKRNGVRAATCGILKNPSAPSTNLAIARDAPWIVGVQTSHTFQTGFLISRRHVLVNARLFKEQSPKELFNNPKERTLISSTLPNDPSSEFFVNVQVEVCVDVGCKQTKKEDVIAWKISQFNYSSPFAILELPSPVSATPICLTNVVPDKGDKGIQQDFRLPEKLKDEVTIISETKWLHTNGASRVNSSSEVLIRKVNDRYFAIGFLSGYKLEYTFWKSIPFIHHQICGHINCKEKAAPVTNPATTKTVPTTVPPSTVTRAPTKAPTVPITVQPPATTLKPTPPTKAPATTKAPTVPTTPPKPAPPATKPKPVVTTPPIIKSTVPLTTKTVPTVIQPTTVLPTTQTTLAPTTVLAPKTLAPTTVAPTVPPKPPTTVKTTVPVPVKTTAVVTVPTTVLPTTVPPKTTVPTVPKPAVSSAPSRSTAVTKKPTTVTSNSTVTSESTVTSNSTATPTTVPPITLSKLSIKENEKRQDKCGPKMPEDEPESLSFGRAPWIVQVLWNFLSNNTLWNINSTGFLISKRHILVDKELFRDQVLKNNKSRISELRVAVNECGNARCDNVTTPYHSVKTIAFSTVKPEFYILELAENLRISTVCIAETSITKAGDKVIIPNYRDKKTLSDKHEVSKTSLNGEIHLKKPWGKDTHLSVMVQRIQKRMVAVGFYPRNESENITKWHGIGSISETICEMTGVCPRIPIREELKPRVRQESLRDEFPDHPEFKVPIEDDYVDVEDQEEDDDDEGEMMEVINGSDKKSELFLAFWVFVSWFLVLE